jgi:hypothetical protein
VPTSTPTLGAGLGHGVDVDRPEGRYSVAGCPLRSALGPTGSPRTRNGHAHLGYVLASPVSRTLKARATPQRFLARIQHGLTMAPRCGQGLHPTG